MLFSFQGSEIEIGAVKIPPFIVGDQAYPLMNFLMKIYPGEQSEAEEIFNAALKRARIIVEQSFADLKNVWSILGNKLKVSTDLVPQIIISCCILHNVIKEAEIISMPKWLDILNSRLSRHLPAEETAEDNHECNESAIVIRNALANFLVGQNEL